MLQHIGKVATVDFNIRQRLGIGANGLRVADEGIRISSMRDVEMSFGVDAIQSIEACPIQENQVRGMFQASVPT